VHPSIVTVRGNFTTAWLKVNVSTALCERPPELAVTVGVVCTCGNCPSSNYDFLRLIGLRMHLVEVKRFQKFTLSHTAREQVIAFSELIYSETSMLIRRDHQGAPTFG
jgi:hypothetical protein